MFYSSTKHYGERDGIGLLVEAGDLSWSGVCETNHNKVDSGGNKHGRFTKSCELKV